MNVLEKILIQKHNEVDKLSKTYVPTLGTRASPMLSLKKNLETPGASGIIAEFKRKSPSNPDINISAIAKDILRDYEAAGASGVSVLTDEIFFGGKHEDITVNAPWLNIPILRKDFIIDKLQIFQSYDLGASVILLIAAALTPCQAERLAQTARHLNMEVLLEIHEESELDRINEYITLVGVNNRNLKTMEVSLETSLALASKIPTHCTKISESGIRTREDIFKLRAAGYSGFLIGENFMKHTDPGASCKEFIKSLTI